MEAVILKGREVAERIRAEIAEEVLKLKRKGLTPTLAILSVGDSPDTMSYIKGVEKTCNVTGVALKLKSFREDIGREEFLSEFMNINDDLSINGIIVMQPLPSHIEMDEIRYLIKPEKDVDCISPVNLSKVFGGEEDGFMPCTAEAVMTILKFYGIELKGKEAVVIGRSMVIGRPVAMMLLKQDATVTICHSKTEDLPAVTRRADIVIAAVGKPNFVQGDFIKKGAVVIDVGINTLDGKLVGDVDFEDVVQKAGMITPVPGGVGSVTTGILLKHVIRASKL